MTWQYLAYSIVTVTQKGKRVEDTAWHRLIDFSLSNQEGKNITWESLKGKIVIADFFFTHCPTICPGLTMNMKRMAESIHNGQRVGDRTNKQVHFLSFSIDPERDSVERLKYWADRFQINPENWWLLTGDKKEIYDMVINEMKVGLVDGNGVDTNFIHSDLFVLIDSNQNNIQLAQEAGLESINTDIYSDALEDNIELNDVGFLMALTGSADINDYAIKKFSEQFGETGSYRLITVDEMYNPDNSPREGLFSHTDNFISLTEVARKYPEIHEIELKSKGHYDELIEITNHDEDIIPLLVKDKRGVLEIISSYNKAIDKIEKGYKLVYLGKPFSNKPKRGM